MKTLEQVALEVANSMNSYCETYFQEYKHCCYEFSKDELTEFLRLAIAKLTENVEPVAWESESEGLTYENHYSDNKPLYPASAIAAIQQQTAEACAKLCDFELNNPVELLEVAKTQTECASQILSGEWRKYLKDPHK